MATPLTSRDVFPLLLRSRPHVFQHISHYMGSCISKPKVDSVPPARTTTRPGPAATANPPLKASITPAPPPAPQQIPQANQQVEIDTKAYPEDITGLVRKSKEKASKAGGFSDVWEGIFTPTGQKIAIKCLRAVNIGTLSPGSPEAHNRLDKRLQREMLVWKPLKSPRVVPCMGYATLDNMPCLISPWYANGNLQDYLKANPRCNRKALIMQVAEGLAYLHGRNVVHYDVKSPNILVGDNGEAMLSDFGIAKVLEETRTGLTTSNSTALSIRFSSPEALEGGNRDLKSDVYSFGCLVLEIMTGKVPYYDLKIPSTIIAAKFRGSLPAFDQFPELSRTDPLWNVLSKCWDPEPSKRPTMAQVIEELSALGFRA